MTYPMALVVILVFATGFVSAIAFCLQYIAWLCRQTDRRTEMLRWANKQWPTEFSTVVSEQAPVFNFKDEDDYFFHPGDPK